MRSILRTCVYRDGKGEMLSIFLIFTAPKARIEYRVAPKLERSEVRYREIDTLDIYETVWRALKRC